MATGRRIGTTGSDQRKNEAFVGTKKCDLLKITMIVLRVIRSGRYENDNTNFVSKFDRMSSTSF